MKKRLVLLITLVVSLFIYSGRVEAGKEDIYRFAVDTPEEPMSDVLLSAMCGDGYSTCTYICKRDVDDVSEYTGDATAAANCSSGVNVFYVGGFSRENQLSDLKRKLQSTDCNFDGKTDNCYKYVVEKYCSTHDHLEVCKDLKDESGKSYDDECFAELSLKESDKKIKIKFNYSQENEVSIHPSNSEEDSNIILEGDKVTGYGNTFYLYGKGSNFDSFKKELISRYKESENCPVIKFCRDYSNYGYYTWYTEFDKCDSTKYGSNDEQTIDENGMNSGITPTDQDKNSDINDCKSLFGDELYDKINEYFGLIRLLIPILLIGYGILDFSKAVFGNEEDMKKIRKKFIMRIVAAVLFFLLPVFLKLILSLANNVWSFINPDTCIR